MQQVHAAGLNRSAVVRTLIMQSDIRPKPPDEYADLLRSLSGMANNLNQIAKIANTDKRINDAAIHRAVSLVDSAWRLIKDTL